MATLRNLFAFHRLGVRFFTSSDKPNAKDKPVIICEGFVEVRQLGVLAASWKWMWLELHDGPNNSANLVMFEPNNKECFLQSFKIDHVERIPHKRCCLLIEAAKRTQKFRLKFSSEQDLYSWLDEMYSRCPTTGTVNYDTFQHNLHVRHRLDEQGNRSSSEGRSFQGFPNSLVRYFEGSLSGSGSEASLPLMSVPNHNNNDPILSLASSADTNLPTPKTTLPVNDFVVITENGPSDLPRLSLPEDHIGYMPSARSPPKRRKEAERLLPFVNLHRSPELRSHSSKAKETVTPFPALNLPSPVGINVGLPSAGTAKTWSDVPDLTHCIERLGTYPVASGGYSDIYQGRLDDGGDVRLVGIKAIRAITPTPSLEQKLTKRLNSEIDVWQRLHHTNIVELLGVCQGIGQHPALVSWWYENGHVMNYLDSLGDAATLALRLKLLWDVAKGLAYLHGFSSPVLHGDLKGANVLVDKQGIAMLTDFGLSSIFETFVNSACLSGSGSGILGCSVRWMAVELVCSNVNGDGGPNSTSKSVRFSPATDVYSFGSTMLEILTGKLPYHHRQRDVQVIMDIYQGSRHRREDTEIKMSLWNVMEMCWMDTPDHRPQSSYLVPELLHHYNQELRKSRFQTLHSNEN